MRTIKLILEYDGTDFCGWQIQPTDRTVQGELEKALQKIFKTKIGTFAAGRTDSGVHARGQIACFSLEKEMPTEKIRAALNGTLPKDVRIIEVAEAPMKFHPRFDATKREYSYRIARKEQAIERHFTWYCGYPLYVDRMRRAATYLLGIHDFQSFCLTGAEVKHYKCEVFTVDWLEEGNILTLRIIANRFLHSMVRTIVGTMIEIGRGRQTPESIVDMLKAKDRNAAGPTAPARGLCLERVYY